MRVPQPSPTPSTSGALLRRLRFLEIVIQSQGQKASNGDLDATIWASMPSDCRHRLAPLFSVLCDLSDYEMGLG